MRRAWEELVGPLPAGSTAAVLVAAGAGGVAVGLRTARLVGAVRGFVTGAVAVDLVGGLVAFALPVTRARYAGSPPSSRLLFVASHAQPFVLPLTGQGSWRRAASRYGTALATTAVLEAADPRAGPRLAVAGIAATVAAGLDLATAPPGQRWLGPVYLLKLVGGHGGIARTGAPPPAEDDRAGTRDARPGAGAGQAAASSA